MAPKIVFILSGCHWPEEIGLEEKFEAKWTIQNQGDAGEAFFGIFYKGNGYFILINGERTFHMDKDGSGTMTIKDCTIKNFFGGDPAHDIPPVDVFKETTTIDITWVLGYYDANAPEAEQYPITDSWPIRTLVKVGGLLPVPTWMAVAGGGLALLAVTGIVLTTRKKR
jgi:hypothetical protein